MCLLTYKGEIWSYYWNCFYDFTTWSHDHCEQGHPISGKSDEKIKRVYEEKEGWTNWRYIDKCFSSDWKYIWEDIKPIENEEGDVEKKIRRENP